MKKVVLLWTCPVVRANKRIRVEARIVLTDAEIVEKLTEAYYSNDEMLKFALLSLFWDVIPVTVQEAIPKVQELLFETHGRRIPIDSPEQKDLVKPVMALDIEDQFPQKKDLTKQSVDQAFEKFKSIRFLPSAYKN